MGNQENKYKNKLFDNNDGQIDEQDNEYYDSKNITVTAKFGNINTNYNQ